MRILIVAAAFYPHNSPRANRATELAKEFARQGHEVKVLTIFEKIDYTKLASDFGISIENLGVRRWKSPHFGSSKIGFLITRAIYRMLSLSFEFPDIELAFLVNKALKNEKEYDLLISIAVPYPVHWGVAWARTSKNRIAKIWVADCGDPYMGCETDSFSKLFYFKYVEKWFMRKADYISIPVESARSGYYDEFQGKIRVIPQGFNIEPITGASSMVENNVPTFAYAGGFIPNIRDPRPFLEYLSTLENDFKFIVYTNTPLLLTSYQGMLNGRLEIREYIPRKELLQILCKMDFLVNFDNNTGVQVPSKLIDYAMTGRPVLNIKAKIESERIVEFLNGDYSGKFNLGDIQNYNIENVVNKFLALL